MRRAIPLPNVVLASLAVLAAGCGRLDHADPEAVAQAYFSHLADVEPERAKALATFEDDATENAWDLWADDYVKRVGAGEPPWSAQVTKVQDLPGSGGEWALVEVEWKPPAEPGGKKVHVAYMMRRVDGKWRLVVQEGYVDIMPYSKPWPPPGPPDR